MKVKVTMKSIILLFLSSFIVLNAQFLDPYGIYTNYTARSPGFFKAGICKCENNVLVNNKHFNNIDEFTIGNSYKFNNSSIVFKINVNSTNVINLFTDHMNVIKYSLDGIEWSNKYIGQFYTCNIFGEILINITSTTGSLLRFQTISVNNCNTTRHTDNIHVEQIRGNSTLRYPTRSFGFSLFVISNTTGCNLNTYLYYNGSNGNKYNYSIGSSYAQTISTIGDYDISLYIYPDTYGANTKECEVIIHITDLTYNTQYTSPVLFYNGTQIIEYLLLNKTYDPSWSGTINLDGGTSINGFSFNITNLNNSQVYSIFKEFNLLDDVVYFQPLLISEGEYLDTDLSITSSFNFTKDLMIINSTVNINTSSIPVNIILDNSFVIITQNVTIRSAEFQGNNTLNSNSTLNIQDHVILNGILTLDSTNYSGTHVVMTYNSSNGTFSKIGTKDPCVTSNPKYGETQLSVVFKIKEECRGTSEEDDGILYYVVIPIIVILVVLSIIAAILILKVPSIRKRVFPHRDRVHYIRNKSYAPPVKTKRDPEKRSLSADHSYSNRNKPQFNTDYRGMRSVRSTGNMNIPDIEKGVK